LHRSSKHAAALRASARKPWYSTGATCAEIRAPVASKGEHACDVCAAAGATVPGSGGDARLKIARYRVDDEDVQALRERVLARFEAPGPIGVKGVADAVALFRAAPS
jgi:hypothetical protein